MATRPTVQLIGHWLGTQTSGSRAMVFGAPLVALAVGLTAGPEIFAPRDAAPVVRSVPGQVSLPLPPLLVNLDTRGRDRAFLRMAVTLELVGGADLSRARAAVPRIMDGLQTHLRALRPEDVLGAVGTERVREEIARRAARELAPARVGHVLIREMLVQ